MRLANCRTCGELARCCASCAAWTSAMPPDAAMRANCLSALETSANAGKASSRPAETVSDSLYICFLLNQHVLNPDRQLAYPHTGRVIHRVRHSRGDADHRQLTNALGAERVGIQLVVGDDDRLDIGHVGVHRHQVF